MECGGKSEGLMFSLLRNEFILSEKKEENLLQRSEELLVEGSTGSL